MFKTVSLFFAVALAIALTSIFASAQCSLWGPPADGFQMPQTNGVSIAVVRIRPVGPSKNTYLGNVTMALAGNIKKGQADLTISGSDVQMRIYWYNKQVGVYNGKITSSGRAEGTGYEQNSPGTVVKWFTRDLFECVATQPEPVVAPPAPKPTGPTGPPVKTRAPKSSSNSAGPYIRASQSFGGVPAGQDLGKTTLTWDAGPGINYAELWVKIDDQPEKYLNGHMKGSEEFDIEPGRNYLFFLKASKKRLTVKMVRFSRISADNRETNRLQESLAGDRDRTRKVTTKRHENTRYKG